MEDETPLGLEIDGYNSEDLADADADVNTCLGDEDGPYWDEDEDEYEDDGQPSWEQEWRDFGEDDGSMPGASEMSGWDE